MVSARTWERIERRQLRGRERQSHRHRPGDRPDPSRRVGTDLLPQIRHIVVLMMENHSYDNYLGTLGRGDGLPTDGSGVPTAANTSSRGEVVTAHRLDSTEQQVGVPTQAWDATHEQFGEGRNDGFI